MMSKTMPDCSLTNRPARASSPDRSAAAWPWRGVRETDEPVAQRDQPEADDHAVRRSADPGKRQLEQREAAVRAVPGHRLGDDERAEEQEDRGGGERREHDLAGRLVGLCRRHLEEDAQRQRQIAVTGIGIGWVSQQMITKAKTAANACWFGASPSGRNQITRNTSGPRKRPIVRRGARTCQRRSNLTPFGRWRILVSVATPESQELRWDVVDRSRSTPSARRSRS